MEEPGLPVQLWHCLQDTTKSELSTLVLKCASGLEKLLEDIQKSALGKIMIITQRVAFSKLMQLKGETVQTFLGRLQEVSKWCEFGVDTEAMCGAVWETGPGLEGMTCGTVVEHRASYQDH